MDEDDIFRKLGFGLNFNKKKFKKDERTNPVPEEETIAKKRKIDDSHKNSKSKKMKSSKSNPMNDVRKAHQIVVHGSDVPEIVETFDQLESLYKFNSTCINNITKTMGFKNLTPIQMQAIPAMLHRRELLACAPTGSGKTLGFLLPVIHHVLLNNEKNKKNGFQGLILSPTRELAEQTFRECKQLLSRNSESNDFSLKRPLLRVKVLNKKETKIFTTYGAKHSNKIDILVTTPNRLVYLLQHDPPLIRLDDVEWLVVDESDKLFEDGKKDSSFREQLGKIYSTCTNPNICRVMFSATFAFDVQQWCLLNMDNVLQITIGGQNTAVKTVDQELRFVGNEQGKLMALQQIMHAGFTPPVLVFVQSKERAKELFAELIYDGKNVDAIHADRTPTQRENAVKCFRRGETWILICTELMGRGIDFKGVNLVINYDFPTNAVNYIHRIGRTGRAGRTGKAITFFTDDDKPLLQSIASVIRRAGCEVPEYMTKLKKPRRKDLKKLAHNETKRRTIRTAPPDLLKKMRKKKKQHPSKSPKSTLKEKSSEQS